MFLVGLMTFVLTLLSYLPFLLFVVRKCAFSHENGYIPYLMKNHMKISDNHDKGNEYFSSFFVHSIGLAS